MAVQFFDVPMKPIPQRFTVELGGRPLAIVSRWNDVAALWFVDLYDGNTLAPLILSMPLVTGADLLAQYRHVGLAGSLVAFTDGSPNDPPTFANLGSDGCLVYAVSR